MENDLISNIRIVLVGTTHPGNIGATARAMKTMGLSRLYLVQPKRFPCAEATARASGADDILVAAQVCETLPEALSGAGLVIATTARERTLSWPLMEPRQMANTLITQAAGNECAIVFGREHSGLSNQELHFCHAAVTIPSADDYSSLNLAAAVQIIAYEIRLAWMRSGEAEVCKTPAPLATSEQMESFYTHLEQTMMAIDFFNPEKPKQLLRRLRRLFNRAGLEHTEVQILRGLLTAVQKTANKSAKKPG